MRPWRGEAIAASCDVLARIDVAAALADHAMSHNWCRLRPRRHASCLDVTGGRHPVAEAALSKSGERFVPNDVSLSERDRLWLAHRPNMGGKSTFLRQPLIVVLRRRAVSCPRRRRSSGLSTRLFSRVGASDNPRAGARPSWSKWSKPGRDLGAGNAAVKPSSTRSGAGRQLTTGSRSPGRWSRR